MKASLHLPEIDLKAWAREHLEVGEGAKPAEARQAFLGKLAEYDFLPPPDLEESHDYLVSGKIFPSCAEQALLDEECRLRAEVDEYARGFFDMEPFQRRRRFHVLTARCAWSANLSARLHALERGLGVSTRSLDDASPAIRELGDHIGRLFTLAPAERGRRRWELLQELRSPGPGGQPAQATARDLQRVHPDLADLEPVLIDALAKGDVRRRNRPRVPDIVPTTELQPADSSGGSRWPIFLIVPLLLALARGATSCNSAPPTPKLPPFQVQMPKFEPDFNQGLLQQELKKLREKQQGNPVNPDAIKARDDILKKWRDRAWPTDLRDGGLNQNRKTPTATAPPVDDKKKT